MQVTGEAIHKMVWVQSWLVSFKARKSWHQHAGFIVSQHKREWQTDLDSTKTCLMRVITACSIALDQLRRPWDLLRLCASKAQQPLVWAGILRAANLPDPEFVAAHDPAKNPVCPLVVREEPLKKEPAQASGSPARQKKRPYPFGPKAHLEQGQASSLKARLSKPPPPVKKKRSKKKKVKRCSSSSGSHGEPHTSGRNSHSAGWSIVPKAAVQNFGSSAQVWTGDESPQQSDSRGSLLPPWRAVEFAVPTPPPPVPPPVIRLVPAARDSHPPNAERSQCGSAHGSSALSSVPMPPPPIKKSTKTVAPRLPLPPQAVPDAK
eukprot:6490427-Amphidinium_carterae.3